MSDNARLREIRAKLDAIAPYDPDGTVTAAGLAKCMAVSAQIRWVQMWQPGGTENTDRMAAMLAAHAAARALEALARRDVNPPGENASDYIASEIRDAQEDGEGVGAWLWEYLGEETARAVTALTEEWAEAEAADA